MADDVLINKSATVERCVARARDVFELMARGQWIDDELDEFLVFTRTVLQRG